MTQALTPGSFLKPSPTPMLVEEGRKDTERGLGIKFLVNVNCWFHAPHC